MDEQELRSLFSAVPGEAPESTFSADDVVGESKRQTRRLRNRIAVGGSAVILVAAGFGVFGVLSGVRLDLGPTAASSNDAGIAQSGPGAGQPEPSAGRPLTEGAAPNFSTSTPQQGGDGTEKTGPPRAEGAFGCDKVDGELATALAGELPAHVVAAATAGDICSTALRAAGFPYQGGMVSAAVFPSGGLPTLPENGRKAFAATGSGGMLVVFSRGAPDQPPPFEGDLFRIAAALAQRF